MKRLTSTILAAAAMIAATFGASGAQAKPICVSQPTPTGIGQICIDTPTGDPKDPCQSRPQGDGGGGGGENHNPLCATGPAECIGYGLWLAVDPNLALPSGAYSALAHSHAFAAAQGYQSGFGFGYGHDHASTQQASIPGTLGEGIVESTCDAYAVASGQFMSRYAAGEAEAARLNLDLNSYGVPLTIDADVLHEQGYASSFSGGANTANIADVTISSSLFSPIVVPQSAPANTAIPLGPLGTLYLNEQFVSTSALGCTVYSGDALRLVLNNPLGGQITLILSWTSNAAC